MEKSKTLHHRNMRIAIFSFLIMTNAMAFGQGSMSTHVKDSLKREDSIIMSKVVHMPEFPGGERELSQFILKKISQISIDTANEEEIGSWFNLRFIVNEDGSTSDFIIRRSISPDFDKQATEIFKSLPKFKPALDINNRPVKSVLTFPLEIKWSCVR